MAGDFNFNFHTHMKQTTPTPTLEKDGIAVDEDPIYNFFATPNGKKGNYQWTCRCLVKGTGTHRMITHAIEHHARDREIVDAVEMWRSCKSRNGKRTSEAALGQAKRTKMLTDFFTSSSTPVGSTEMLNKAAALAIIACALSLGFFDNHYVRQFVDCVGIVARLHPKEKRISNLLQSRRIMSEKWVPKSGEQLFLSCVEQQLPLAQALGSTLCQDGRSNVRISPPPPGGGRGAPPGGDS